MQFLTADQKQQHISLLGALSDHLQRSFLSRVITGDKSWIYGYDPTIFPMENKKQSQEHANPFH
jgi:hypothetical protein